MEEQKEENPLDRAERIKEEMKAENDRRERLINEERELKAREVLSGGSSQNVPQPTKELTDHEYRLDVEKRIRDGEFKGKVTD